MPDAPGVAGLRVGETRPGAPEWPLVERFVQATDPVRDLLLWADVISSIAHLSRIWLAERDGEPVGVAFAFPLWPDRPTLGVKGHSQAIETALLQAIAEQGVRCGFVITEPAQIPVYEAAGAIGPVSTELHMTLSARDWRARDTRLTRPASCDELDAFYRAQGAGAWNPVQCEAGPYAVIADGGRIVASAGTHFAYPALAQVGNVFTDPAHRGCGHASAVTARVVDDLVEAGHRTISLFVAESNAGARGIYERLGFQVLRPLAAFRWDHLPQS